LATKTPFGTEEKYRKYGGFQFQRQGTAYAVLVEEDEDEKESRAGPTNKRFAWR